MQIPKPPKKVKAPDGDISICLTQGKEYDVVGFWEEGYNDNYGYRFKIINDIGFECYCIETECANLKDLNWIVTQREE